MIELLMAMFSAEGDDDDLEPSTRRQRVLRRLAVGVIAVVLLVAGVCTTVWWGVG